MNLKPIIAAWVIAVVLASAGAGRAQTPLAVKNLRCEYQADPVGIDVRKPRLSWQLESSERGVAQTSYEVRVAGSEEQLAKGKVIWQSGKQTSDASIQVEYGGPALESARIYYWQVRVADNHGHLTGWSKTAHWEMGLLEPVEWKAKWITPNLEEDETKSNPAPLLRREFSVKKKVERARLYATAMGLYEMELNGNRVGDQYFTPGWTSYDFRYQYQTYDVTGLLKNGTNCLGAMLGDGWFRGRIAWGGKRNSYGKKLALLTQLVIRYTDGTQEIVGCDEKAWKSVSVVDAPKAKVVAQAGPAVKEIEEIQPAKILKTPAGDTVIDMGQNMVGWMRFRVNAPAGTTITLRHAEVLDSAGNFYTENLRSAQEKIRYTTKGQGPEIYQPHFTFQGFRYVAVSGWPGEVKQEDFTGVVVHSAMARTGTFESSSSLLNQLQHNIIWGQKGNFVGVPTDCPQRDERLGWTGDAQVFAGTASFNHDTAGFYTKWLKDVALDQEDDGAVPFVIPNVLSHETRKGEAASAGWADVAVILPWTVYQAYGDKRIFEEQYTSMKAWVEYMRRQAGESYLWKSGSSFGDWLAFATTRADYPGATTDKDLIQTAYFAHSTALLAKTAKVLGKTEDAAEYESLEEKIKRAFQEEYLTSKGRLSSNTQTAYALALAFELLPETMRPQAAARLAADVKKFGHLTTGFLGTPALCQALSDYGYLDEAYLLLNRKEYPSWLYPVTKGATTIWERWDGTKPDGSFQNPSMNSFNHYAYGAIGDWMYRVAAGIEIDEKQPGYKHILIQPRPGGGLTSAKASVETLYGHVESGWKLADGKMALHVEVPANTTAMVRLSKAKLDGVTEGGKPLVERADLSGA